MSSNFENLPLPVIRDSQDFSRLVPAGETVEIPVIGEFVYCKFSDGTIDVVVNGKSTQMESGDERRMGGNTVFRGVTLRNDSALDKSIDLVIGFGGFNRRIIQGEVTIAPGIRDETGQFISDTRYWFEADFFINNITPETFTYAAANQAVSTVNQVVTVAYFPKQDKTWYFDNNDILRYIDNATEERSSPQSVNIGDYFINSIRGTLNKKENAFYMGAYKTSNNDPYIIKVDHTFALLDAIYVDQPAGDPSNANYIFNPLLVDDTLYCVAYNGSGTSLYKQNSAGTFDEVGSTSWSFDLQAAYCADGERIVVSDRVQTITNFASTTVFDAATGETLTPVSGDFNLKYGGHYIQSQRRFVVAPASPTIAFYNSETWTRTAEGFVMSCAKSLVFSPENTFTDADITGEQSGASVTINGEVIKAALEMFSGQFIRSDYLDYIYAVQFNEESGIQPKTISAGGDSFALAEIDDDFTITTPQHIKFYARDGLFEAE